MLPRSPPTPFSSFASVAAITRENVELRRRLGQRLDDELDSPDDEPTRKGKKTKKKAADEDKNDQEDDQPGEPDRRHPEGPEEATAYWGRAFALSVNHASPEAILVGVKNRGVLPPEGSALDVDSYRKFVAVSAAMVLHCAGVARGEDAGPQHRSLEVGDDAYLNDADYRHRVDRTVAAVVAVHNRSKG